jgi:FAD/FMN-containing dehydrogenase
MSELFSLDLKPALVDLTEEPEQGLEGTLQKWKTTMYLVFEGFVEEVEAQLVRTLKVCIKWNGEDVGPDIARNYWDTRHDSAYRYKERYIDDNNPQSITRRSQASTGYPHVALPPSRILEYRKFCHEVAIKRNLNVREYSLWTRPELFSIILVDMFVDIEEESNQLAEGVDEILKMAQDLGGSMEYVHGVGVKLVHLLPRELGESMELLKNIKLAIDPYRIMNPGNLNL